MNTKKSVILSVLSLAIVFALIGIPGAWINQPAGASAEILFTPTPTPGKPQLPNSPKNLPAKTDDLKATRPQASLPSPSAPDDILNGDFENGSDGSWEEYSLLGYNIILHRDNLPVSPHSGDWAAWLGGQNHDDEVSYISQSVAIPLDASTLGYWHWIDSVETCGFGYDFAWVRINDTDVTTIDLCELNNTGGWVHQTVDISAYAGTTVTLEFRVETDYSNPSNYFVDYVTFDQSVYLPLILNNFWVGYFDDFSDPNSGWASGENATTIYRYLSGEYQIYLKQANSSWAVTPDLVMPSDYRIEVDARKVSPGDCSYGLIFGTRWTSTSWETYQFVIWPTSGEFYVEKRTLDGSWTQIQDWTYSSAINLGYATNHIQVDRIGTAIRIYINGTQVLNITDTSFTGSGRDAGVRAYSYSDAPVDVRFDNFRASQP
jgi:hypothetical protein